jgi:hypothetical protein
METFIIKLAVAVLPLFVLVASVVILSNVSLLHKHHPLSWHRRRHYTQRALAGGVMLR